MNKNNKVEFIEFVWIWNKLQDFETPKHQRAISRWLSEMKEKSERECLLMAFRNSGKSTIIGLFCAWTFLKNPNLRILVMAADHSLAKKMVSNVKRVIERHILTKHLKPKRLEQWASDQFTINRTMELRDPSMMAKGLGANITGSRADIIICDDVEVPKTCDSAMKRKDLREKLGELDFVLVPEGMQIYIGTPHTYYSIYKKADKGEDKPFLDGFKRLEIPIFDKNGNSQWKEKFPLSQIKAIKRRAGPNKFASQMMLKPVNITDSRLDVDGLLFYENELELKFGNGETKLSLGGKKLVSATCWWDPAYGSVGKGDSSVIACVFTDESGYFWLHAVKYLQTDDESNEDAATQQCKMVADFVKKYHLPAVRLETNGIGRFLPGLLRKEMAVQKVRASVIEETSTKSKDLRIIDAFDAILAAKALSVHNS
ncbi:MAG: phage terminase large subunit, partial [Alphaproteobacteria bacterium]|nr:phage terminase large subunit [Alphaproteobacteria bacterium]